MMNPKKLYRLSREEGLTVRRRRGRKRATGTRAPITLPHAADQPWSLDLVADVLSWDGVPVLAIVDDFTREALALVVDTSIVSRQVVGELDALIACTPPPLIVSDNGTGLTLRGRPGMEQPGRHPLALHRAWKASSERLGGKLNRRVTLPVPEREGVRRSGQSACRNRALALRRHQVRPHSAHGGLTPEVAHLRSAGARRRTPDQLRPATAIIEAPYPV
jgi:putative transposase